MASDETSISEQAAVFKALGNEIRLKLLQLATEKPIAAPDLDDEFDVSPESLIRHLNKLEDVGLLESKDVRGPGNHPRKQFSIAEKGMMLNFEIIYEGDYYFELEPVDVANQTRF